MYSRCRKTIERTQLHNHIFFRLIGREVLVSPILLSLSFSVSACLSLFSPRVVRNADAGIGNRAGGIRVNNREFSRCVAAKMDLAEGWPLKYAGNNRAPAPFLNDSTESSEI